MFILPKNNLMALGILMMMVFFVPHFFTLAEEENAIGDKPEITKCEQEMVKAFTAIDDEFTTQYHQMLDLPDITAVAKSTSGNIESYLNTYRCHVQMICPAMANYLYNTPQKPISFLVNQCNLQGKTEFTSEAVSKYFKADLSQCKNIDNVQLAGIIFDRCTRFSDMKISINQSQAQSQFITTTHLENNSFLALKLIDINKKLDVLLEKVRLLTVHFKKINDDISCVNPDSTGQL